MKKKFKARVLAQRESGKGDSKKNIVKKKRTKKSTQVSKKSKTYPIQNYTKICKIMSPEKIKQFIELIEKGIKDSSEIAKNFNVKIHNVRDAMNQIGDIRQEIVVNTDGLRRDIRNHIVGYTYNDMVKIIKYIYPEIVMEDDKKITITDRKRFNETLTKLNKDYILNPNANIILEKEREYLARFNQENCTN